jgi:hypothetical protein
MGGNTWAIVGVLVGLLAAGTFVQALIPGRRRRARIRELRGPGLERVARDARCELTDRWREIQYRFVDDPGFSVREAEHLVEGLMRERGYPTAGFPPGVSARSIGDSELAGRYRAAYATFRSADDGDAGAPALIEALRTYRDLFEALLDRPNSEPAASEAPPPAVSDRLAAAGRTR